jgi:hypothetical protein
MLLQGSDRECGVQDCMQEGGTTAIIVASTATSLQAMYLPLARRRPRPRGYPPLQGWCVDERYRLAGVRSVPEVGLAAGLQRGEARRAAVINAARGCAGSRDQSLTAHGTPSPHRHGDRLRRGRSAQERWLEDSWRETTLRGSESSALAHRLGAAPQEIPPTHDSGHR